METTIETGRAAIGEPMPGYYGIVRPVVRVDGWIPIGVGLETLDAVELYIGMTDGPERVYPEWSAVPAYRITTPGAGATLAVRVDITGRKCHRWCGDRWVRGRLEFCHDGEPSTFAPCWLLVE